MMLMLTNVNTVIRLGGSGVDLTSASSVQQLISMTMTGIHYFALTIALCMFLLAIVRQYTQFSEHMGIRFIGSLLVVLVMIFSFPKICNSVQNATYSYAKGASLTVENMFCWLVEQKLMPDRTVFKIKVRSKSWHIFRKVLCTPFNLR